MFKTVVFTAFFAIASLAEAADWKPIYRAETKGNTVLLNPERALSPDDTHAALVIDRETEVKPVQDFKITLKYQVHAQLRSPASMPNPWETFWLFFNYRMDGTHKKTNYLIIKENGLEVGKAWGEKEQSFAYTAPQPSLKSLHDWQKLTVIKKRNSLYVQLNDEPPYKITLSNENALFLEPGALGLYSEDASVTVKDVQITQN